MKKEMRQTDSQAANEGGKQGGDKHLKSKIRKLPKMVKRIREK